jgi:hypothetical protein
MDMTRLAITLGAFLSLVSVASASLAPRTTPSQVEKEARREQAIRPVAQAPKQAQVREAPSEFVLTRGTEVLLNGQPCKYQDVPRHATIVRMEVAADNKTVLKIHFRARK